MSTALAARQIVSPDGVSDFEQFLDQTNNVVGGFDVTGAPYGGVATGIAASNPVKTATITLTSAQLLALHSTPVVLIAGSTGKAIVPISITSNYTFKTTAYTITGSDGFIYIGYHGFVDANAVAKVEDAGTVDQTSSNIAIPAISLAAATVAHSSGLSLDVAIADTLTLGVGTVTLTITYQLIPVA